MTCKEILHLLGHPWEGQMMLVELICDGDLSDRIVEYNWYTKVQHVGCSIGYLWWCTISQLVLQ